MKVNPNTTIEVIHRLNGRANSHRNAAKQTNCKKKSDAHMNAFYDLIMLRNLLLEAFENNKAETILKSETYKKALNKEF